MGNREGAMENLGMIPELDYKSFYSDRRVLVTGHTGFKGSWLTMLLTRLGARVTGYALDPPTDPNLFHLAGIADSITSVRGDVRNYHDLKGVIRQSRPEIVIHMAAQALVREAYRNPRDTYETNVMGTVNILDAVRDISGVRSVVIVTSDKCYENMEWCWGYRESDRVGGSDPYSGSKGCAELVSETYRRSFFSGPDAPALVSVRAGNVIGGGDWAEDRLIPDILKAVSKRETLVIRNPSAVRPWQHVLEPLTGYLRLACLSAEKPKEYSGAWNFGPEEHDAATVSYIVRFMQKEWDVEVNYLTDISSEPHEAHYLKLDCSKARLRLGWQPKWGLEYSLRSIVEWFHVYMNGGDIRQECLRQIEEFLT